MLWSDLFTARVSFTDIAMCMNLINESSFNNDIIRYCDFLLWKHNCISYALLEILRKGVVWLNWVAKWVAVHEKGWKPLPKRTFTSTTANEVQDIQDFDNSRIFTEKFRALPAWLQISIFSIVQFKCVIRRHTRQWPPLEFIQVLNWAKLRI